MPSGINAELVIVYNRILDAHAVKLTEWDMNRKGGWLVVCSLSPAEFERMLPNEATHEGPSGKKRHSSHFTGWPGYEQTPNTYATSDPTYFVNDSNAPEPTELTSLEKERADLESKCNLSYGLPIGSKIPTPSIGVRSMMRC